MPKYFCDYCDTYLTHDSPSVRKTHCAGRKHRENVKFYYEKWYEQNIQKVHQRQNHHQGPMIPPPGSLPTRLDLPPPLLARGLPTGPPPPLPNMANVMIPPPSMLNPHQPPPMTMPPSMMVPPHPAAGSTLLPPHIPIPPPGMMQASMPPPGVPPPMLPHHPPPLLKRD